jgi:hypothetical protein
LLPSGFRLPGGYFKNQIRCRNAGRVFINSYPPSQCRRVYKKIIMPEDTIVLLLRGFLEVVSQMRSTQKEYFRTREKDVLIKSKQLESQVDKFINDFISQTLNTENGKT